MAGIVGIGACVADTLYTLPNYPQEDTKLRATDSRRAGGGPVATGLVAASKLGAKTTYLGVLSDDDAGRFLKADFEKYGVSTDLITFESCGRSFTSVIWLSEESASRTCVFERGTLPPLTLSGKQRAAISDADLLMTDGNELDAAVEAAKIIRKSGGKVLCDCGGLYPGIERLLTLTDYMIPSEEFALAHTGKKDAEDAARELMRRYRPAFVVVTQGKRGGFLFDGKTIRRYPAYPATVKDSNGAGDVFHGAFAAAITAGYDPISCCHFASAASALKCRGIGARESAPDKETLTAFLKENGYEL